jgi:hypothetical protein
MINVMMALLILLITGYLLYKLITSPIKSLKVMIGGVFLLLLGSAVWLSVFYFLLYEGSI